MSRKDENLARVALIAHGLGDLSDDVAFVGGATIALYVDAPGSADARFTDDVDCVVEVSGRVAYAKLEERLRRRGFSPDSSEGAPLCRWKYRGVTVDVMPTDAKILGFSNRWYSEAMQHRIELHLGGRTAVYGFPLPYLVASKLEAFRQRGKADWFASHDLEDIIAVLDGATTAFDELRNTTGELRNYLVKELGRLAKHRDAFEIISGHLMPDPTTEARANRILAELEAFTA